MASRCIIGKVDRWGNGTAILCARGCFPDEAGAALLGHYSEESLIDGLIALGSIVWLEAEPKECEAYHRDRGYPWEQCQTLYVPGRHGSVLQRILGTRPRVAVRLVSRRLAGQSGDGGDATAELF